MKTDKEKDIGVTIDNELTFDNHISEKVNKANQIFGLLRRTFNFMNSKSFIPLYKSLVRTQLDYASSVWAPFKVKDIDRLEAVQRRATKSLPGMGNLTYPERLRILKLPTLSYRRARGDMIELYKMINGIYDKEACTFIQLWKDVAERHSNRGNSKMLFPQQAKTQLRSNAFKIRTVKLWNSLPESVVSAPNINTFKNRLDKNWQNQDIVYNYKGNITGSDP
ncbi:uncharacterized protein [Argopecten irradians]|uniref:uncharacterized protein n=1 Tax=Argopecten irradians TaxID=31199 RepID=UPI003715BFB4